MIDWDGVLFGVAVVAIIALALVLVAVFVLNLEECRAAGFSWRYCVLR